MACIYSSLIEIALPLRLNFYCLASRFEPMGAQEGVERNQTEKGSSARDMQSSAAIRAQRALVCRKDYQFQAAGGLAMLPAHSTYCRCTSLQLHRVVTSQAAFSRRLLSGMRVSNGFCAWWLRCSTACRGLLRVLQALSQPIRLYSLETIR